MVNNSATRLQELLGFLRSKPLGYNVSIAVLKSGEPRNGLMEDCLELERRGLVQRHETKTKIHFELKDA